MNINMGVELAVPILSSAFQHKYFQRTVRYQCRKYRKPVGVPTLFPVRQNDRNKVVLEVLSDNLEFAHRYGGKVTKLLQKITEI